MLYLASIAALIASYIIGWPSIVHVSDWMHTGHTHHLLISLQGFAHGLTLWAIAGFFLSFTPRWGMAIPLMLVGAVGICGGMVEDITNLAQLGNGWEKDIYDGAVRAMLLTALYTRVNKLL